MMTEENKKYQDKIWRDAKSRPGKLRKEVTEANKDVNWDEIFDSKS